MTRFIPMVLTAFLARVKPVSTSANPTCMNMTRNAPTSTQTMLSDCSSVGFMSPSSRGGGRLGRGRAAAGEGDERAQARQDGDDHQRHGEAPGDPTAAAAGPAGRIAERHGGRVAQVVQKIAGALVAVARQALDGLEHDGLEVRGGGGGGI